MMMPQLEQIKQVKNMVGLLRNASNPDALLQMMIQQNPQMQKAVDYIKSNGGDPKAAFEKLASENGIDPNQIMQMLK